MLVMFRVALRLIGQSDALASQQDNLTNTSDETFNEGDIAGKYATLLHTMYITSGGCRKGKHTHRLLEMS